MLLSTRLCSLLGRNHVDSSLVLKPLSWVRTYLVLCQCCRSLHSSPALQVLWKREFTKGSQSSFLEASRCSLLKGHLGSCGSGTVMGLFICQNFLVHTTPLRLGSLSHLTDKEIRQTCTCMRRYRKNNQLPPLARLLWVLLLLPTVSCACIGYKSQL